MIHAYRPSGRAWCGSTAIKGERVTQVRWRSLCRRCMRLVSIYTRGQQHDRH